MAPRRSSSAPTFDAKFRYGPLLSGELQLYDLMVKQAQVIWPQDADGRWTWPGLPKIEKVETEEPSFHGRRRNPRFSISGLKLAGANIELRDAAQKPVVVATGVDVDFTKVGQEGTEGNAKVGRISSGSTAMCSKT
jgi:uncharacterized protein involved in outer membrane biogenesis